MSNRTKVSVTADVRGFVDELVPGVSFRDEDHLLESGVIQSILLLDLIECVASSFEIEIAASDIYAGHFASVETIAHFVLEKVQGS